MTLKRGNADAAVRSDADYVAEQRARMAARAAARGRRPHGPGGPGGRMMPGEKAEDFKGTLFGLIKFMMRFKGRIILVILCAIGAAVFSIIGPKVLSEATTVLFDGIVAKVAGTGAIDFTLIGQILLATLGIYLFSWVAALVQGWLMTYISQHTCYDLRAAIADKINKLPFSTFEESPTGDVLSRITNDVDTLGQSLNQGITQVFTAVTTLIGVLVMMFSINWIMTLIALGMIPISAVLIMVVVKHSQKYFFAQQATLGAINGQVEETFSGHAVVKAFNREEATIAEFRKTNARLREAGWKSQFFSGLMQPIMNFVSDLGYVAVAITGAAFAAGGIITVGDIQAFIQYVRNFTQPITQLSQVANVLQQMVAAAERIFHFLEGTEERDEATVPDDELTAGGWTPGAEERALEAIEQSRPVPPNAEGGRTVGDEPGQPTGDESGQPTEGALRSPDVASPSAVPAASTSDASTVAGAITFDHVCFGYDPDHPVINDFTATIQAGQTVAIVGPTGAGKTTIVKLLMRFYDPQSGAIRIDGKPTISMARCDVRHLFAMVLQDTWLFNGTIRANIAYGAEGASDEAIEEAARRACADHFIKALPGGYDFEINEAASNLSQGQRQLLTIARALLADRPMLILDEATSSVDTRTEARIQEAMDNLMRGRTAFVIAHRLSTIREADLILVMDKGDIVEQGTHDELLKLGGFYASLYNSQFTDTDEGE